MSLGALIATMALSWRVLNPMNQAFLSITQLAQSRTVIEQIKQPHEGAARARAGASAENHT